MAVFKDEYLFLYPLSSKTAIFKDELCYLFFIHTRSRVFVDEMLWRGLELAGIASAAALNRLIYR